MKKDWKNGDIVRWSYTEDMLKKKKHGNNGGTTYWCCSQIAVFNDGNFWDTYWHGSNNKQIRPDDIGKIYDVEFIANFDELNHVTNDNTHAINSLYSKYDREDIVNLNHSNNSRGNLYIRKNANKKIELMRDAYEYKIKELEDKISHVKWKLEQTKKEYENLSEENLNETKNWI